MPSTLGLFDVVVNELKGKKYIQVIVAKGAEKTYYLRKMGMTPDSCFIMVGSAIESMNGKTILNLFSKRARNSLKNIKSPKFKLSHNVISVAYNILVLRNN